MSKFVKLHTKEQDEIKEIYINLDCVATISPNDEGSELTFATSANTNSQSITPLRTITVKESPDEILKLSFL